jgi:hypothetical protein
MPEVTLSDGGPCEVRTLGIFELDRIRYEFLGPFVFEMTILGGAKKEVEFDIGKYEELGRPLPTPSATPVEELKENTQEWFEHRDWQLYEAAIEHGKQRLNVVSAYADDVVAYILANCISEEDVARIVIESDWQAVYKVALVPQVTEQLIVATLRGTYQAEYDGQEVFDALDNSKGGSGMYNAIRLWENEWANEMGYNDVELATVPVEERARRICAKFLRNWFEFLELEKMRKQRDAAS